MSVLFFPLKVRSFSPHDIIPALMPAAAERMYLAVWLRGMKVAFDRMPGEKVVVVEAIWHDLKSVKGEKTVIGSVGSFES